MGREAWKEHGAAGGRGGQEAGEAALLEMSAGGNEGSTVGSVSQAILLLVSCGAQCVGVNTRFPGGGSWGLDGAWHFQDLAAGSG